MATEPKTTEKETALIRNALDAYAASLKSQQQRTKLSAVKNALDEELNEITKLKGKFQ